MVDRSIPFFNTILRCDAYDKASPVLPEGYTITAYRAGDEDAWARMEHVIGDFDTVAEAKAYVTDTYLRDETKRDRLLFAREADGRAVGACFAWHDPRMGKSVNSLHWLVVDEAHQGRGLGRALSRAVMNRYAEDGGAPIYIHTQPWSHIAVSLYVSLGFRLQKTDSFSAYINQYADAARVLETVMSPERYGILMENTME